MSNHRSMVGHWCHKSLFKRKNKCFTRKANCFMRKTNCFTRKTKILQNFNTLIYA